jgi:hypothetical protein
MNARLLSVGELLKNNSLMLNHYRHITCKGSELIECEIVAG